MTKTTTAEWSLHLIVLFISAAPHYNMYVYIIVFAFILKPTQSLWHSLSLYKRRHLTVVQKNTGISNKLKYNIVLLSMKIEKFFGFSHARTCSLRTLNYRESTEKNSQHILSSVIVRDWVYGTWQRRFNKKKTNERGKK